MADEEHAAADQDAPSRRKKGVIPTFDELAQHHADMQAAHARHLANTDDRFARIEAAMMARTDEQRALLAAMQDQVATNGRIADALETLVAPVATAETGGSEPGEANAGTRDPGDDTSEAGTTSPAGEDGTAAGQDATAVAADGAAGSATDENASARAETEAAREEEAPGEALGSKAQTADDAGDEASPEETARTVDESEGKGLQETVDGDAGEPETQARGETCENDEAGDAGKAESPAAAQPTIVEIVEEIAATLAARLPLAELDARLETLAALLATRQEASSQEAARSEEAREKALAQVMEVLSALRADLDTHGNLLKALHRTPQPAPDHPSEETPEPLARLETLQNHKDVVTRLDAFINSLGNMLGPGKKEEKDEDGKKAEAKAPAQPRLPPTDLAAVKTAATDLSKQLRAEHRSFSRFAWIAAAAAAIAMPALLTLGILVRHEYALVPPLSPPDPTLGWKDRVWSEIGAEAAKCISRQDNGGDCVITITTPAE